MYLQRNNYTRYNNRSNYRKNTRPTNRVIQAGTQVVEFQSQATAYVFEATDPCTATNFKLDTGAESLVDLLPMVYALVYVPEGYGVNTINYPSTAGTNNLYDPSKSVLISGVLTSIENEDHKFSKYSRKMATGDRIALIYYNSHQSTDTNVSWELSFTTLH